MNEKFEIGEIAVVFRPGHKFHGEEALIVGPLEFGEVVYRSGGTVSDWHYNVEIKGNRRGFTGGPLCQRVCHLRKKQPPREDLQLVRWSECPWQPEVLSV